MGCDPIMRRPNRVLFPLICVVLLRLLGYQFALGQDASTNAQDKLSRQFTQSATSAMVSLHQVKQNIATVLEKNLPGGYYDPNLAARAYENVRTAQTDATTNGDQQTATLLDAYFTKVKTWAEKYKAARQSMNATRTMGEDFLTDDPEWQAINTCEKALNTLLTQGVYHEIRSCQ
jgi:hypothetical protein